MNAAAAQRATRLRGQLHKLADRLDIGADPRAAAAELRAIALADYQAMAREELAVHDAELASIGHVPCAGCRHARSSHGPGYSNGAGGGCYECPDFGGGCPTGYRPVVQDVRLTVLSA